MLIKQQDTGCSINIMFSLKFWIFSEQRKARIRNILKYSKKTQYLMNTLYCIELQIHAFIRNALQTASTNKFVRRPYVRASVRCVHNS